MAELSGPFGGGVIDVPEGLVDRYVAAGWAKTDEQEKGLSDLKVDELKQVAADEGIDLGDATKKADIVAAIETARAASQQD